MNKQKPKKRNQKRQRKEEKGIRRSYINSISRNHCTKLRVSRKSRKAFATV